MLPAGEESPPERFEALLAARLAAFRLPSTLPVAALAQYLAFLDFWRRRTNLTGPLSPAALVEHLLECALGADLLPARAAALDIGSGAGLPGIPLAILRPDVALTPVEPRRRRREFLDHAGRELGLSNWRPAVSSLRGVPLASFSAAVSRAVGGIGAVIGTAPFLAPRGLFVAWTTEAPSLARELATRFRAAGTREIPGSDRKTIAWFEKVPGRA